MKAFNTFAAAMVITIAVGSTFSPAYASVPFPSADECGELGDHVAGMEISAMDLAKLLGPDGAKRLGVDIYVEATKAFLEKLDECSGNSAHAAGGWG